MAEYKDEGLLDKILTLVAPPLPPSTQKGRGGGKKGKASSSASSSTTNPPSSAPSTSVRHSGMQNHPYCDACGDGGNLLCCDKCPASFHFNCCDPPIDPNNIPSGEWLCRHCRAEGVRDEVPSLFRPLVESAATSNPRVFCIPYEMQRRDILPGSSRKELKQARLYHHGDLDSKEQCKYCYACNKNSSHGRMVSCDFCPLIFHLDCLHPPLTIPPTTVWMCPVHPNAKIPGSDHPRLSQRLKALERSQADIPFHTIKTDFIKQLRKVPHYKRITRHHNRRVTEVPSAVKSLYRCPLPDVLHVPSVSDSLLTSSEDVLRWRDREERERRLFGTPRQPTLTHNQDEWTRRTVFGQLYGPESGPTLTGSHSTDRNGMQNSPTFSVPSSSSSSVLVAAQQLLELSASRSLGRTGSGAVGAKGGTKPDSPLPPAINGFVKPHPLVKRVGMVNGDSEGLCVVDEEEEGEEEGQVGEEAMELQYSAAAGDVASLRSPHGSTQSQSHEDREEEERKEEAEDWDTADIVPDLSVLDAKVVQVLALQRLQQLLSNPLPPHLNSTCEPTTATPPVPAHRLEADVRALKEQEQQILNGWSHTSAKTTHQKKGSVHTAAALLCPLSGTTTPLPLHKQVNSVGVGSEMDVCLSEFGHCNYISARQACIFYDKATQDYELINYSEHGTVVDGVLYSCDFSHKSPTATNGSVSPDVALTLDDLCSLGRGRRASRARARLEAARRSLRDKQEAKRALEAALQLSAPLKDDLSLAEEMSKCEGLMTRTGLKRVAATEGSGGVANSISSSVVLSIPLAKTKKTETGLGKKGVVGKRSSPSKPPHHHHHHHETGPKSVPAEVKVEDMPSLVKQEHKVELSKSRTRSNLNTAPGKGVKEEEVGSDTGPVSREKEEEAEARHSVPCGCTRSFSSVVGAGGGKGWEGTAALHHGSRLHFGCLQFVMSFAGQPGHAELVQALDQLEQERDDP